LKIVVIESNAQLIFGTSKTKIIQIIDSEI